MIIKGAGTGDSGFICPSCTNEGEQGGAKMPFLSNGFLEKIRSRNILKQSPAIKAS